MGPNRLAQSGSHSRFHRVCVLQTFSLTSFMLLVESALSSITPLGTIIYCRTQGYLTHLRSLTGLWRHLSLWLLAQFYFNSKNEINRPPWAPPGVSTPSIISPEAIWVEPRKKVRKLRKAKCLLKLAYAHI